MKTSNVWFEVDRKGLKALKLGSDPSYVLFELAQNCFDAPQVTQVKASLTEAESGSSREWCLTIEDNSPKGFVDVSHAYVVFAESIKKHDPTLRGRFNLGEKLAFAIANEVIVDTVGCRVHFHRDGTRTQERSVRKLGSRVDMYFKVNKKQVEQIMAAASMLLVPQGITFEWNGVERGYREPTSTVPCTLPTEFANEQNQMVRTERKTTVDVHRIPVDKKGWLYEMGIPVMEHSDPWDYDVQQRIPVGLDRQGLNDSRFMKRLRTAVFNTCYEEITPGRAHEAWVRTGAENPDASKEAVQAMITARFGDNAMIADPSDPEANNKAIAAGHNLILGGHLPGGVWNHIRELREDGLIQTTSAVYGETWSTCPPMDPDKITDDMKRCAKFARMLAKEIMLRPIIVGFINEPKAANAASYSRAAKTLTFNYGKLGKSFFAKGISEPWLDLIIHEFGHQYESNHLSENYYRALTRLAASAAFLALQRPARFLMTDGEEA